MWYKTRPGPQQIQRAVEEHRSLECKLEAQSYKIYLHTGDIGTIYKAILSSLGDCKKLTRQTKSLHQHMCTRGLQVVSRWCTPGDFERKASNRTDKIYTKRGMSAYKSPLISGVSTPNQLALLVHPTWGSARCYHPFNIACIIACHQGDQIISAGAVFLSFCLPSQRGRQKRHNLPLQGSTYKIPHTHHHNCSPSTPAVVV